MPFENNRDTVSGARLLSRLRLAGAALVAALLLPAAAAHAAGYQNPFSGEQPIVGRTDMGVDVCLSAGQPILAAGSGVVVGIQRNWYEREPYIWYELTDGPDAGRYVYVAEQIDHLARVGQVLAPGDVVGRYARKGTCIETGWSTADGETLAAATTGYKEGEVTTAGASFAHFLISLGVPGDFEVVAARATGTKRSRRRRRRPVVVAPPGGAPVTASPVAAAPVPLPTGPLPVPAPPVPLA